MEKRPTVPTGCFFQGCYNEAFERQIALTKRKCSEYNKICPSDRLELDRLLSEIIESKGENAYITPPFWCDYGYNITLGDNFYANHNLIITDGAKVTFGDSVFVAPNCCFTTAQHAIDPQMRRDGVEAAFPITVGNNVWIGAGTTVLPGVTIGDNTVIGAGSVVTRDIPEGVVAFGVPCRVYRKITEDDKYTYPVYNGEY